MFDHRLRLSIVLLAAILSGCAATPQTDALSETSLKKMMPAPRDLAVEAERRGDWAGAAGYWKTTVEADPSNRSAILALARAQRLSGACGQTSMALAKLVQANAADADALVEMGKCHLVSGRLEAAESTLSAAIAAAPTSWEAETTLAVAMNRQGRHAEAQPHHDRAVQLAPDRPSVLANRALSLALGGDLAAGLTAMRQAAALPGAGRRVRVNLAVLEAITGSDDRALLTIQQEGIDDRGETMDLLRRLSANAANREAPK